jgi:hypothetical protein
MINKEAELYLPQSFPTKRIPTRKASEVKEALQIRNNIFNIGELNGIE